MQSGPVAYYHVKCTTGCRSYIHVKISSSRLVDIIEGLGVSTAVSRNIAANITYVTGGGNAYYSGQGRFIIIPATGSCRIS